mmetsp:Transcript_25413/g.64599  ORF Transcript_25413/g.64599 Transcript_25413/m.64599 type:complete len:96 (-) Transcript_25413:337-624(-)
MHRRPPARVCSCPSPRSPCSPMHRHERTTFATSLRAGEEHAMPSFGVLRSLRTPHLSAPQSSLVKLEFLGKVAQSFGRAREQLVVVLVVLQGTEE